MPRFLPHYFPHSSAFIVVLALVLGALMLLLASCSWKLGFRRLGISRFWAILLLWACLLGSGINIPVARLPAERIVEDATVDFFGMTYVVPEPVPPGNTLSP